MVYSPRFSPGKSACAFGACVDRTPETTKTTASINVQQAFICLEKLYNQSSLTSAQAKDGAGVGARAGAQALSLIAEPLNLFVLETLAEQSQPLPALLRASGSPPQTTMRARLRTLTELGILEKRRRNDFPGTIDYALLPAGAELRAVAKVVQAWLSVCPDGPIALDTVPAKSAIKALVEAWSSSMIRALAARPLSLIELDRAISGVSYPSLERRLSTLHLAGQVIRTQGRGRGTPYAVTEWLRQAVAPLAAAARWERHRLRDKSAPITNRDAEAAFLLILPLLSLPAELSGACRLTVEFPDAKGNRLAGVRADVDRGRVTSCVSRLEGHTHAWASGSASNWLRAVMDREPGPLEMGGDCTLANAVVDGLQGALSECLHDALSGCSRAYKHSFTAR
jgi:DNA-binding HxlR family transcriptional regulator